MAVYFVDSSALVKRYIAEAGSNWVLGLFDPTLDHEFLLLLLQMLKSSQQSHDGRAVEVSVSPMPQVYVINSEMICKQTIKLLKSQKESSIPAWY